MNPLLIAQLVDIANRYWKLVAVILAALFLWYVLHLRSQVTALKAELAQSQAQLQQYKDDMVKVVKAHDDLKRKEEELRRKTEGFVDPIAGKGKDSLSKQAREKPQEIQRKINEAIKKALLCLETVTAGGEC